eukprot:239756_1
MAHSEIKQQYTRRTGCPTTNVAMIVCKNKDNKYLSMKGDIPAFFLDHNDKYSQYFGRGGTVADKIKEQCGVVIEINGMLRIEHTENNAQSAHMRVIYYAEPMNDSEQKQQLNVDAKWVDIPDKKNIIEKMKGNDLYSWINYLEYANGIIYPMNMFTLERESVKIPNYKMPSIENHNANYLNIISFKVDQNDEQKTE